jgi:hypothetical protein
MDATRKGEAVRPAGVPMVPMPQLRPGGDDGAPPAQSEAVEAGKALASEATRAGGQIAGDVKARALAEGDRRSTEAGERVAVAAGDVRGVAEHLRGNGREGPARLADEAAERIDRFADYLRHADTSTMLADIRDIGRRQPAALVAGAAVVGIVAGRLIKASDPEPQEARR